MPIRSTGHPVPHASPSLYPVDGLLGLTQPETTSLETRAEQPNQISRPWKSDSGPNTCQSPCSSTPPLSHRNHPDRKRQSLSWSGGVRKELPASNSNRPIPAAVDRNLRSRQPKFDNCPNLGDTLRWVNMLTSTEILDLVIYLPAGCNAHDSDFYPSTTPADQTKPGQRLLRKYSVKCLFRGFSPYFA